METAIAATTKRVPENTAEQLNRLIEVQTECNVKYYMDHPDQIDDRLSELDQEWDIERTLEANAAAVALGGLGLGAIISRKFMLLPLLVGAFLLQHAIQGWCPPVAALRRLGVRTQTEIETERYALKLVRGDFSEVAKSNGQQANAAQLMSAVTR